MYSHRFTFPSVESALCSAALLLAIASQAMATVPYSLRITTTKGNFDIAASKVKAFYNVGSQKVPAVFHADGGFTIDNLPAGTVTITFVGEPAYFQSKREPAATLDVEYEVHVELSQIIRRAHATLCKANQLSSESTSVSVEVKAGASLVGKFHWSARNGADLTLDDWANVR